MKVGIANTIVSYFGIKHNLLAPRYRNRNPRAITFQKALYNDLKADDNSFSSTFSVLKGIGIAANSFHTLLFEDVKATFLGKLNESEFVQRLNDTQKTRKGWSPAQQLEMSMHLLSMGMFKASYELRQQSYKSFNALKNRLPHTFNIPALKAAWLFDQGAIGRIDASTVHRANERYWDAIFCKKYRILSQQEQEFASLVSGKRIAIIGPLTFKENYKEEIEAFDTIVELNALNSKRQSVQDKYHGKPDIVYYNNFRLKEQAKSGFDDLAADARFFVIKHDAHLNRVRQVKPTRVMPPTTMMNWNGSFSMMENTVADLLLFNPAEIKVFGVNLYTGFKYDKSYGNAPPEDLGRITLNFTVHDIYTQYMFMHNLNVLGLIKGDREFDEVLRMGIKGYVHKMSEIYPYYLMDYAVDGN